MEIATAFALNGIAKGKEKLRNAAHEIANGDTSPEQLIALKQAENQVKANAKTISAEGNMIGTIINEIA